MSDILPVHLRILPGNFICFFEENLHFLGLFVIQGQEFVRTDAQFGAYGLKRAGKYRLTAGKGIKGVSADPRLVQQTSQSITPLLAEVLNPFY